MASFTFHFDMVVSGSVQIDAETEQEALAKRDEIMNADDIKEMIDGLDLGTACIFDGSHQLLNDETGENVF